MSTNRSMIPALEPPFQFRLRHLFMLTAAISVVLTGYRVGEVTGGIVALLLLQTTAAVIWRSRELFMVTVIAALLFLILLPATTHTRHRDFPAGTCRNNLKQLALALHNYHDANGHLPPVFTTDENGLPMHSWRVHLLPFMEMTALYEAYDFNEPWDGSNNRKLGAQILKAFQCPSQNLTQPMTSYVAVWGPDTAFPGPNQTASFRDITNNMAKTILLVELPRTDIHWMEPRDLTLEEFLARRSSRTGRPILHAHGKQSASGIIFAVAADGSVQQIPDTMTNQELLEAIRINDGKKLKN